LRLTSLFPPSLGTPKFQVTPTTKLRERLSKRLERCCQKVNLRRPAAFLRRPGRLQVNTVGYTNACIGYTGACIGYRTLQTYNLTRQTVPIETSAGVTLPIGGSLVRLPRPSEEAKTCQKKGQNTREVEKPIVAFIHCLLFSIKYSLFKN